MARFTPPTGPPQDALGQVLLFQAADGQVALDVRLEADTVWLSQAQMGELFGRERSVITRHVGNVFREGELPEPGNVHFLHTRCRTACVGRAPDPDRAAQGHTIPIDWFATG